MIAIILAAVLVITVVLMNEYGWADLTGNTRNNLVFETRNKSYGAYEIRQKYSTRLLLGFFGALGFMTLVAFSPKFFPKSKPAIAVEKGKGVLEVTFDNKENEKPEEKPEEKIPENKVEQPKQPSNPDISTFKSVAPIASDQKQPLDTAKVDPNAVASNQNHKGTATDSTGFVKKPGDGDCIDCPPVKKDPPTGGEIKGPAEVTEQATFEYMKFFQKNMRIPEVVYGLEEKKMKVYVSFVVDESGNVTNVAIKKGVVPALDNEVKRVAASMPKWKPAKFNENPVKVRMTIPVTVVLE